MENRNIAQKVSALPEDVQHEVMDYIEFLMRKYGKKTVQKKQFRFDWEGGLADLKGEFTAVELQHQACEWR